MFRRLHKDKKSCKMDDPRHIGISKLNFAFGLVLGGHGYQLSVIGYQQAVWAVANEHNRHKGLFTENRRPITLPLHFREIRYVLVSTPRLGVNAPVSVGWIHHEIKFFSAVIGVRGSAPTRRRASEFL